MKKVKLTTDYQAKGEHEGDVVEVADEAAKVYVQEGWGKIVTDSKASKPAAEKASGSKASKREKATKNASETR